MLWQGGGDDCGEYVLYVVYQAVAVLASCDYAYGYHIYLVLMIMGLIQSGGEFHEVYVFLKEGTSLDVL